METGFLHRAVRNNKFVVYVPRDFKPDMPAILFLHGMGESGTDGLKQTAIGLGHSIRMGMARWPFVVVMPQKPDAPSYWADHVARINEILIAVEKEFQPDPHRRYITGLSQGGCGTFELANNLTWQFAAAAPVCGWARPADIGPRLKSIPVWAFHGTDDPVVKVEESRKAIEAIKAAGGDAKLTEFAKVGHNSWDSAYAEPDLPSWFLSHSLA